MHKDPQRRYASAKALIADLDRYLNQQPLQARPDSWFYVAEKFLGRNRKLAAAAAVVLILIAAAAALIPRTRLGSGARSRTVAVLPFQNIGSDHSVDFLSLALPDEIATTLSYTRSLAVRPFTTTRKYVAPDVDLQAAGREMRVASIVTGHFLKVRDQIEVTLEAVDVETNRLLRRDTFDVAATNMIAMQAQIAARAQGGLAETLGVSPFGADPSTHAKNEEAYDLFLRNTALSMDAGQNTQAIAMLERSVALDPTYSPAWYTLGRRYYVESHYYGGGEDMTRRYEAATERALALDPASVSAASGLVLSRCERGQLWAGYRQAEDLVRRFPDSADAHFSLSYALRYAGLLGEAAKECESAFALDANTQMSGVKSCAVVFILRGNYSRAMDYINLDLGSAWAKAMTIDVLARQGKSKEALQPALAGPFQWGGFDLLIEFLRKPGRPEIARLASGIRPVEDPEVNYFTAAHLAYAGQNMEAIAVLKAAIDGGYCSYPAIDSDVFFGGLRGNAQFPEIRSAARSCQTAFLAQRDSYRNQ